MYGFTVPALILLILLTVVSQREGWALTSAGHREDREEKQVYASGTVLFAPDVMLGRSVELRMDSYGRDYPFQELRSTIEDADLAVVNFEASVPAEHVPTAPFTFQFSVKEEYFAAIPEAGFDVLSLANNHALDFGHEGYINTRMVCERYGVTCVGHPTRLNNSSYTLESVGSSTVGILMLHTLFSGVDRDTLESLLTELSSVSDVQFAFVHWGEEYVYGYTKSQETLAHILIDGGIDAVIGHHPHVIAPVSFYKGKPIFYSLGNFVFDQYWNTDVQTGFLVSVLIEEETLTYTLMPYESYTNRSQPRPLEKTLASARIESLLSSYTVGRTESGFTLGRD